MLDGYWIMFGSGFMLGCIFYMIGNLTATLIRSLNEITKKKMESDKINDANRRNEN